PKPRAQVRFLPGALPRLERGRASVPEMQEPIRPREVHELLAPDFDLRDHTLDPLQTGSRRLSGWRSDIGESCASSAFAMISRRASPTVPCSSTRLRVQVDVALTHLILEP